MVVGWRFNVGERAGRWLSPVVGLCKRRLPRRGGQHLRRRLSAATWFFAAIVALGAYMVYRSITS